jgi:hypothetical protein
MSVLWQVTDVAGERKELAGCSLPRMLLHLIAFELNEVADLSGLSGTEVCHDHTDIRTAGLLLEEICGRFSLCVVSSIHRREAQLGRGPLSCLSRLIAGVPRCSKRLCG